MKVTGHLLYGMVTIGLPCASGKASDILTSMLSWRPQPAKQISAQDQQIGLMPGLVPAVTDTLTQIEQVDFATAYKALEEHIAQARRNHGDFLKVLNTTVTLMDTTHQEDIRRWTKEREDLITQVNGLQFDLDTCTNNHNSAQAKLEAAKQDIQIYRDVIEALAADKHICEAEKHEILTDLLDLADIEQKKARLMKKYKGAGPLELIPDYDVEV